MADSSTNNRLLLLPNRPTSPPALQRLPGKARPRDEVLRECEAETAEMRKRIPRVLWVFLIPDLSRAFRWRVQLDCGCITEVITREDGVPPHEMQWDEPIHNWPLPMGQMICRHADSPPEPYRDIAEWGERKEVSFPADPVEPPDYMDPQAWSVIRHDEPHTSAFWTVTLACGHLSEAIAPELDWVPASGPHRAAPERVQQMSAEFERVWLANPELQTERDREHTRRMLAENWPTPRPETLCYTCTEARWILAYERIGWLIPRQRKPAKSVSAAPTPSRSTLERRLRKAEAEAERLRVELGQFDEEAIQQPAHEEHGLARHGDA
ncbi:hypothetical protein [Streptomyces cinereospinus]|uniref:Uncharacterized protein n=1 Tax=Streptomyces cinereospinus TaxID=285561 RepID=A0ABV5N3Q0_9ACTN